MITVGFTGTSHAPLAPRQRKRLEQLLWNVGKIHLGDCINADAEAHDLATALGVPTAGHPPTNPAKRAFLDYDEEFPAKDYLARNHDIVEAGVNGLIACPRGWVEEKRSGTWATIRYAVKLKRHLWIIRPDGSVKVTL